MARRGSRRRRSPADWAGRAVLAAGVAAAGYVAIGQVMAYSMRTADPERALAIAPWDGRIAAILSENLSAPGVSVADRARSDRVARQALRQDPTAVAAVATLGLNAQVRGDAAGGRRLFGYAASLSRRDLRTQLWAIEDSVARGDVPGALRNYDIALRTSRYAPDLLFPVLAGAVAEPQIRAGLVKRLAAGAPWGGNFTDYLVNHDPDPVASASLFGGLLRAGVPVTDGAQATLIGSLMGTGAVDQAWSYYSAIRPGADRRRSRDPRFAAVSVSPTALDWTPVNDAGVSTSIQRGTQGGVFDFTAPPSVGGPLLSQMQILPSGNYVLQGHGSGLDQPEGSRPYWVLSCRDGREFGRVVMPNSDQANGSFAGRFTVPAGCPVQYLSLVARPSDMVSGLTGQLDRVELRPAR